MTASVFMHVHAAARAANKPHKQEQGNDTQKVKVLFFH